MKRTFLPFLTAICIVTACNDTREGAKNESANTPTETTTTSKTGSKVEDGPAIATIETETYVMKIHKAIPFMPDDTKTAGAFKTKEGNQFIALDISVNSKSNQSLEMGTILLATEITDEKGIKFGEMLPAVTAYTLMFPDPKQQEEYDAIWSEEYVPGQFHRTVAFGFEAPKDVKTFIIKMPTKPNANEMEQATFTL
jgi:hypothetical protein